MGATNITKLKGGQLDSVKHTMGLIKINIEKYLERLNKN